MEKRLVITDTNTVELTAVVTNQMNEPVNEDEIVWSVSDPSLATITGEGATATVTGVKAGKVVVTAAYGELKGTFNLYIFETKPAKEIRENFEGFAAGTPAATAGYTFSGNAVIATGEGGQGTNVLKLTKTAENAQLQVDFGQPVTKGSVSLLVKKPAGSGSFNVSLAGAGKRAGFQLTNNNGFRHRNTEGSSSQIHSLVPLIPTTGCGWRSSLTMMLEHIRSTKAKAAAGLSLAALYLIPEVRMASLAWKFSMQALKAK